MSIPTFTLNDGHTIPAVGFGTYPLKGDEGIAAVGTAIEAGYRLIDTAVNYRNEREVGEAIRRSGLARDEFTIATKIPGRDHGYEDARRSIRDSLEALGVERTDLHLIHWPNPITGKFVDAWRALVDAQRDGEVRSIGVSNFTKEHLARIIDETGVTPAVNQIELHPYFPQVEMVGVDERLGIRTEAWSPLGKASDVMSQPVIVQAAIEASEAAGREVTGQQVVLRWHLQRGVLAIPKSANAQRQRDNLELFDFELTDAQVAAITALGREDGRLFGGDPNTHEEQ